MAGFGLPLALFNEEVARISRQFTHDELKIIMKKIGFEGLTRIGQRTPVLTGRARNNWQVSINDLPGSEVGDWEDRDKEGVVTTHIGLSRVADVKPGQAIFIANNVPYIERLEEGWSQQSDHMVANTFNDLRAMFS
jgi:hypothetical protein